MVEVLQREGIDPDLIVGCSAGAMFGALISLGHSAHQAEKIATQLWTSEVARQHRWCAIPQMIMPKLGRFDADFSMRNDRLIMQRLRQAFGNCRLEDLQVPLRVAATHADAGHAVFIRQGNLVDALRASVAMPFMFAPHPVDGQRLSDGFAADPLPVGAATDAHTVIALGFDAPMPHRVNAPSRLLAQITSTMTNNLMHARLAAAEASGMRLLRVFPKLERRIGLFDTQAMPYLIEAGRRATEAMLPTIIATLEQRSRRPRYTQLRYAT